MVVGSISIVEEVALSHVRSVGVEVAVEEAGVGVERKSWWCK